MTDEQRKRIHNITYSTQDRMELAERIVKLEDERDMYSELVEVMDHPDTADQLREENAKLRMSVRELLAMVDNGNNVLCTLCPFENVCDEFNGTRVIGRRHIGCMVVENVKEREIEGIDV